MSCNTITYCNITNKQIKLYELIIDILKEIKDNFEEKDEIIEKYTNSINDNTFKMDINYYEKLYQDRILEYINKNVENDDNEIYMNNLSNKIENMFSQVFNLWVNNNTSKILYKLTKEILYNFYNEIKDVKDINDCNELYNKYNDKLTTLYNDNTKKEYYQLIKNISDTVPK